MTAIPSPTATGLPPVPVRSVIENPEFQRRFDVANDLLATTTSGRAVAEYLDSGRVNIRIFGDAEYSRRFPGSGASFQPAFNALNIPQSALSRMPYATTMLAHEGQHALDNPSRPGAIANQFLAIVASSMDGVRALTHLRNPMTGWLDGFTGRQNEFEVSAYRTQANVALELGINQGSWAIGSRADGSVRTDDEIRDAIATTALYRLDPMRRLAIGAGMGVLAVTSSTFVISTVAGKVAPKSYLGTHVWPLYAVGAALAGAALLSDQVRARALERVDPR